MNNQEIRAVFQSFDELGIPPTLDRGEILKAFRKRAKETHPDLHEGSDRAHNQFIHLTECRDRLLQGINDPEFLSVLYGEKQKNRSHSYPGAAGSPPIEDDEQNGEPESDKRKHSYSSSSTAWVPPHEEYEEEWNLFKTNQEGYFSIFSRTTNFLQIGFLNIATGILCGFVIAMYISYFILALITLLIILILTLGFGVTIPFLGWMLIGFAFMFLWEKLGDFRDSFKEKLNIRAYDMISRVAQTGYPRISFWLSYLVTLVIGILVAQLWPWLGWTLIIFFNIGYFVLLSKIHEELKDLSKAFSRLRKRTHETGLVLIRHRA